MSSGDHGKVEPPGSIPNPEVKHLCADGSVAKGHVRVGRCQNYYPRRGTLFPAGVFCALPLAKWAIRPKHVDIKDQTGDLRPGTSGSFVIKQTQVG